MKRITYFLRAKKLFFPIEVTDLERLALSAGEERKLTTAITQAAMKYINSRPKLGVSAMQSFFIEALSISSLSVKGVDAPDNVCKTADVTCRDEYMAKTIWNKYCRSAQETKIFFTVGLSHPRNSRKA